VALGVSGLGISEDFAIAQVDVDEIVQFAREKIQGLNPDCLFISGTFLFSSNLDISSSKSLLQIFMD